MLEVNNFDAIRISLASPDDQLLICSGDARLIRIASKLLTSSMAGYDSCG